MLLKFKCNLCGNDIKKLFKKGRDKIPPFLNCECGGVLEKQLPNFGTSSLETVDNGNMARKVELRRDVIERSREKGDRHKKLMETRERQIKDDENNS